MAIEKQYSYAIYGTNRLCKRDHDTATGAVTEYVPCTDAEQAAFEAKAKAHKDALRIEIRAAEREKAIEAETEKRVRDAEIEERVAERLAARKKNK